MKQDIEIIRTARPERPKRRKPGSTLLVRLNRAKQVEDLIKELRAAKKLSKYRGGNVHVSVHDAKNILGIIMVDLTTEAFVHHVMSPSRRGDK